MLSHLKQITAAASWMKAWCSSVWRSSLRRSRPQEWSQEMSARDPAEYSQSAAVGGLAFGQDRGDSQPALQSTDSFRVIASIGLESLGFFAFRSALDADRRHGGENRESLGDIPDVGGAECPGQRNAVRIGQEMMFGARFTAIGGVRAGVFASFRILGECGIVQARDQSIWLAPLSAASCSACMRIQTPDSFHQRRCSRQVLPQL